MSRTVCFFAPLRCFHCGALADERKTRLQTFGLISDPADTVAHPGDILEVEPLDLEDGYHKLRDPDADFPILALEQWSCPQCRWAQWALIEFRRMDGEHHAFVSAREVELNPETVSGAHFISRKLDFWLAGHPGEESERILPFIRHLIL